MGLGNVYVASVCMGANMSQSIRALKEAMEYRGTSLVMAYAPCIEHGLRRRTHLLSQGQSSQTRAVARVLVCCFFEGDQPTSELSALKGFGKTTMAACDRAFTCFVPLLLVGAGVRGGLANTMKQEKLAVEVCTPSPHVWRRGG